MIKSWKFPWWGQGEGVSLYYQGGPNPITEKVESLLQLWTEEDMTMEKQY